MLKEEGTWDIRCPGGLFELREKLSKLPNGKPRPYYWKVNVDTAKQIADILARAYHIRKCAVKVGGGKMLRGLNGCYVVPRRAGERPTIYLHSRPHMKTATCSFTLLPGCVAATAEGNRPAVSIGCPSKLRMTSPSLRPALSAGPPFSTL